MIVRKIKVNEYEYQPPINYVAGATEPDIQFQITDYVIPSGAEARAYVQRFDGSFEYTLATIDDQTITIEPTGSMFSVKGEGAIQVTLYVGDEVVKNFSVPVFVHADLADDAAQEGRDIVSIFHDSEQLALEQFREDAEQIAEEVTESIPADYTALSNEVDELNERLDHLVGVPAEVRQAIYNRLLHIPYLDDDGDADKAVIQAWASVVTEISLDQSSLSISGATTSQLIATTVPSGSTVAWSSSDESVAEVSNNGYVTGVGNGTCTITASAGDLKATCAVTVSGFATLTSINAVYTPSGTVYATDTLDSLKDDLVVTAIYSDQSTRTITNYSLSGTLELGTCTISVNYGSRSTTFDVAVKTDGWLYMFDGQTLASVGTHDFGFKGTQNYAEGHGGSGYCYHHVVTTEGDDTTDQYGIYADDISDLPSLSGDFTISLWYKSVSNLAGAMLAMNKYNDSITGNSSNLGTPANIKTGWTVANANAAKATGGSRMFWLASQNLHIRLLTSDMSYGREYTITPPSSFDSTKWHHYALTRSGSTIYFFIDGEIIFTVGSSRTIAIANQINLGNYFALDNTSNRLANAYGCYFDDLYFIEKCRWSAAFDPTMITY